MSLSDLFAVALWPLVATGVWLIVKNRGRKLPRAPYAPLATYFGLALVLIPLGLLLEYFLSISTTFLVDKYIFSLALGAVMLLGARLLMLKNKSLTLYQYGGVLIAVVCIGYGVWHLVGDFLLPRQTVQGFATRKHSESTGQYGIAQRYHVAIGGKDYQTTAVIYRQVPNGALVRARVGTASHMVLEIEMFAEGSSPASRVK